MLHHAIGKGLEALALGMAVAVFASPVLAQGFPGYSTSSFNQILSGSGGGSGTLGMVSNPGSGPSSATVTGFSTGYGTGFIGYDGSPSGTGGGTAFMQGTTTGGAGMIGKVDWTGFGNAITGTSGFSYTPFVPYVPFNGYYDQKG